MPVVLNVDIDDVDIVGDVDVDIDDIDIVDS